MSVEFAETAPKILDEDAAKTLASEIIAGPGHADGFDAHVILKENPGLARYRSIVLDLAYEEFCRCRDAGKSADPEEFARRFPSVEQSLLRVLEVHDFLDMHPDVLPSRTTTVWPVAGDEIAGFALVREIGRGGFSRVFLARETELGNREVVVKICNLPNDEAARLGRLSHPNIVPIHSVRTVSESELTIICMPHTGHTTLAHVLDELVTDARPPRQGRDILRFVTRAAEKSAGEGPSSHREEARVHWTLRRGSYAEAIIELGAQICDALAYAHEAGICHCDVKPSNVLVTAGGKALLFDFNLSLQRGGAAATVGGTLPYMSPEQMRYLILGADPNLSIDHRTDIFSLGVTLFHLLVGRLPFQTDGLQKNREKAAAQLLERHREGFDEQDHLQEIVGPRLARLIARCLAFERDDRPASAESIAIEFRRYLSWGARTHRWFRKHRLAARVGTVVLVSAAILFEAHTMTLPPPYVRDYDRAIALLEDGNFNGAGEAIKQGTEASKNSVEKFRFARGWVNLLQASRDQGLSGLERTELLMNARKDFEAFEGSLPDSRDKDTCRARYYALISMGYCCAQLKDPSWAIRHFRNALEVQTILEEFEPAIVAGTELARIQHNLGYCYILSDDYLGATKALKLAIDKDPHLQAAYHNLAVAESRLASEARAKAAQISKRAAELKNQGPHDYASENRSAADQWLRQAELYTQDAVAHIDRAKDEGPRTRDLERDATWIYVSACLHVADDPSGRIADQAERKQTLVPKVRQSLQALRSQMTLQEFTRHCEGLANLAPKWLEDELSKAGSPLLWSHGESRHDAEPPERALRLLDLYPDVRDFLRQADR